MALFTNEIGNVTSDCEPWFVTVAPPTLKSPIGGGSVMLLGDPIEMDAKGSNPALIVVTSEMTLWLRRKRWGFVTLLREESRLSCEVRFTARLCPGSSLTAGEVDFAISWPADSAAIENERSIGYRPLFGIFPLTEKTTLVPWTAPDACIPLSAPAAESDWYSL